MSRTVITPRTWMSEAREKAGLTRKKLSIKAECSEELIRIMEDFGCITHPNIASRIAHALGVGVDQYNDMVHETHRASVVPKAKAAPKLNSSGWYTSGYIKYW